MERTQRSSEPGVLRNMAHLLGTELKNHRLNIPEKFGAGYFSGFVFNEHIRMLILNYKLNHDLMVENPNLIGVPGLLFKFQHIFHKPVPLPAGNALIGIPFVLIATMHLNSDVLIPAHTHTATINIEVDADYLNRLFNLPGRSPLLQGLLENTQPLLFEQLVHPSLQQIINEIVGGPANETFQLFYLRVKAEELVCRLLMELEKREEKQLYALNNKVQQQFTA